MFRTVLLALGVTAGMCACQTPAERTDQTQRAVERENAEKAASAKRSAEEDEERRKQRLVARMAEERLLNARAWRAQHMVYSTPHEVECASTYRARFIDMQQVLTRYPTMRAELEQQCNELAKHCTAFSAGGLSICHRVTDAQRQTFDKICSGWPRYRVVSEASAACADVDPEPLGFDFTWTDARAAHVTKMNPPL